MTAKEFIGELNGKEVEGELIKTFLYSFIISIAILGIVYFVKFRYIDGFLGKYGLYLLLASISLALITSMIRQVRAYKEFACMSGMMIGMTAGMISGFDIGLYLGATNGMLYGSILGMLVGIFIGIWMGKCCGIMGVMEGLMAGFMGGIMGAMTAVMMINDNLKVAVVIISIVTWVILVLLNYMIYKETRSAKREHKDDAFFTIFWSLILTSLTIWLMIFGPRSLLFQ